MLLPILLHYRYLIMIFNISAIYAHRVSISFDRHFNNYCIAIALVSALIVSYDIFQSYESIFVFILSNKIIDHILRNIILALRNF